jgi:excinuclease ABC subunit C
MAYPAFITDKLAQLPATPGVYLYKDKKGKIIYVGKAAVLRSRVRQYFQEARPRDTKTDLLVADIADISWIEVGSEIEALFLESELIKRYKPKYNIELRDDKHYEYVRIDIKSPHPTVRTVRRPMDDQAVYLGPFVYGIRPALHLLRRIFPYDASVPAERRRASLHYHIGLSPGLEAGKTTLEEYRKNLRRLIRYLSGQHASLERQLEKEMKTAARAQQYERAAQLRNQVESLSRLRSQIIFGDKELFDITKDQALDGLAQLLGLPDPPRRIEGYDISHMSGTNNVASMVVFTGGVSDKGQYRKFKMQLLGNDDFAHMREVITRRFSGRNLEQWPKPDLILIDGGKGQVGAALDGLQERALTIPLIGLAKRYEEIIVPKSIPLHTTDTPASHPQGPTLQQEEVGNSTYPLKGASLPQGGTLHSRKSHERAGGVENYDMEVVVLPHDSPVVRLLQRVRDESHRFAVSYHSVLKGKAQTHSILEDLPGIGPATRKKLIRAFGSLKALQAAPLPELQAVLGETKGSRLFELLHEAPRDQA